MGGEHGLDSVPDFGGNQGLVHALVAGAPEGDDSPEGVRTSTAQPDTSPARPAARNAA